MQGLIAERVCKFSGWAWKQLICCDFAHPFKYFDPQSLNFHTQSTKSARPLSCFHTRPLNLHYRSSVSPRYCKFSHCVSKCLNGGGNATVKYARSGHSKVFIENHLHHRPLKMSVGIAKTMPIHSCMKYFLKFQKTWLKLFSQNI